MKTAVFEVPSAAVQVVVSAGFSLISFGPLGTAPPAAPAGPGCPDSGSVAKLIDCITDPSCGREILPDEQDNLKKLAQTASWQTFTLGKVRADVFQDSVRTWFALGREASAAEAVKQVFRTGAIALAAPDVTTDLAFGLPCGANAAPCEPSPDQPQCPPSGTVAPRDAIRGLPDGGTLIPSCLSCDLLCEIDPPPSPQACACFKSCKCP